MRAFNPVSFNSHWKPIEGWPYQVSDTGQVARALPEHNTYVGRLLKPNHVDQKRGGYTYYVLCNKGKTKTFYAHVLVANTWIGPKPSPESEVRHLDGDNLNNRVDNLAWYTPGSIGSVSAGGLSGGFRRERKIV